MKRIASLALALILLCACVPALADDGYNGGYTGGYYGSYTGSTLLSNLTHNCPNTGIMLPESFSPYQTTYLLTVASGLCLAGLKAIDRHLSEKGRRT